MGVGLCAPAMRRPAIRWSVGPFPPRALPRCPGTPGRSDFPLWWLAPSPVGFSGHPHMSGSPTGKRRPGPAHATSPSPIYCGARPAVCFAEVRPGTPGRALGPFALAEEGDVSRVRRGGGMEHRPRRYKERSDRRWPSSVVRFPGSKAPRRSPTRLRSRARN